MTKYVYQKFHCPSVYHSDVPRLLLSVKKLTHGYNVRQSVYCKVYYRCLYMCRLTDTVTIMTLVECLLL